MPTQRVWDKHEIKAEIARRGQTLTGLGEMYGIPGSSIRVTLMRKAPITTADQVISDFLKVPLHELWPDRYDDKGHRLVKLRPTRKPIKAPKRKVAAAAE